MSTYKVSKGSLFLMENCLMRLPNWQQYGITVDAFCNLWQDISFGGPDQISSCKILASLFFCFSFITSFALLSLFFLLWLSFLVYFPFLVLVRLFCFLFSFAWAFQVYASFLRYCSILLVGF